MSWPIKKDLKLAVVFIPQTTMFVANVKIYYLIGNNFGSASSVLQIPKLKLPSPQSVCLNSALNLP